MTPPSFFIPYQNKGGVIVDWNFTSPIHCLSWHKHKQSGYAVTQIGQQYTAQPKEIRMHRLLLNFPPEVDHINGIRYDNRMCNIRSVTRLENNHNRPEHRNGRLPCCFLLKSGKWRARIQYKGKKIYLSSNDKRYFDSEEEAYEVVKEFYKKHPPK